VLDNLIPLVGEREILPDRNWLFRAGPVLARSHVWKATRS